MIALLTSTTIQTYSVNHYEGGFSTICKCSIEMSICFDRYTAKGVSKLFQVIYLKFLSFSCYSRFQQMNYIKHPNFSVRPFSFVPNIWYLACKAYAQPQQNRSKESVKITTSVVFQKIKKMIVW